MLLSKDEVEHIARLARLRLNDKEKAIYSEQLSSILAYVNKMQAATMADIEPTSQITDLNNIMREDVIKDSGLAGDLINGAPDKIDGYIKIPKIFEDKN
ncbi:MAG: Asp-tRNA(Asn)/Glu-tRNA(Gln) amidotransferase subunit GatC [Patescibacteria group bacterium]